MDAKVKSDLHLWVDKMGFNGKQVGEAVALIGLTPRTASNKTAGVSQLTQTERLAMAAARAGLPEWTPETDEEIADLGRMREIIKRAAARQE